MLCRTYAPHGTAPIPGITPALPNTPSCSKTTAWKCAKPLSLIAPPNLKRANAVLPTGSPCLANRCSNACLKPGTRSSLRPSSTWLALISGRTAIGNSTIAASASPRTSRSLCRSGLENYATIPCVALYTQSPACYIFLPYRHPNSSPEKVAAPGGWASDREPAKRVSVQRLSCVDRQLSPQRGESIANKNPPSGNAESSLFARSVSGPLSRLRGAQVTETKEDTLLKLRKVEITGFKSFCERTVVTFSGTGTTCIVGPNGCGKSNVVDAISWVLGEQSHKSLRAGRMSDCIFNGTVKRPPMGLAEVTITLEDPELAEAARFVIEAGPLEESAVTVGPGEPASRTEALEILMDTPAQPQQEILEEGAGTDAPLSNDVSIQNDDGKSEFLKGKRKKKSEKPTLVTKPGEVVVSRRLYRSGQSEYLINGRVARLRDIQDMFMGVGLGPDSYAIIEQGRIGQILSTKPMERRAIIEEAAGVTKFKTRKRLAEAKLESSKINLSRVNDIVVEVEKQLGSLKRQAAKARRYSEIREQMRAIVRQMLA